MACVYNSMVKNETNMYKQAIMTSYRGFAIFVLVLIALGADASQRQERVSMPKAVPRPSITSSPPTACCTSPIN